MDDETCQCMTRQLLAWLSPGDLTHATLTYRQAGNFTALWRNFYWAHGLFKGLQFGGWIFISSSYPGIWDDEPNTGVGSQHKSVPYQSATGGLGLLELSGRRGLKGCKMMFLKPSIAEVNLFWARWMDFHSSVSCCISPLSSHSISARFMISTAMLDNVRYIPIRFPWCPMLSPFFRVQSTMFHA